MRDVTVTGHGVTCVTPPVQGSHTRGHSHTGQCDRDLGVWRDDLQCVVLSLSYDFVRRVGTLHLAPENCTDMAGAIALFVAIDPDVQRIETFSHPATFDTGYQRTVAGWQAVRFTI